MDADERLFRELYPALRRFAAVVAPSEDDPDDLVQEALARTLARGPLVALDNPGAYLRRTITNLSSNRRRSLGRWRRARRRLDTPVASEPEYPSDLGLLDSLVPLDRAIVYLVDVERRSADEVAMMVDLSAGAVRSRASRARRQLRELLGDDT